MSPTDQISIYLPLAHLGHWYYMPLYLAPALLILFSAIRTTLKERHRARDGASKAKEV